MAHPHPPKKAVRLATLCVGLLLPLGGIAAPSLTLAEVVSAAKDNLDVQFSAAALGAAQGDVLAADRAPLPLFSLKASQIDLQNGIGAGNFFTKKRVDKAAGLDFTWERGNKRDLRTRVAKSSAGAAEADLDETRVQQMISAAAAYFDLGAAQDRLLELQGIEQSAMQLALTARKRVQVGDLAEQDAIRTEIEARRAAAERINAQQDLRRLALVLSSLIGDLAGPRPSEIRAKAPWRMTLLTENESEMVSSNIDYLLSQRSDVRAAQARVDAARINIDGVEALKKSDVVWGVSMDNYPGTSNRLLELRMQMPLHIGLIGDHYAGEVARAVATLSQARSAYDKARFAALAELTRLNQDRINAGAKASSYEQEILPRAQRVADNAEFAYKRGALSLSDLLEARRVLRLTKLEALTAQSDFAKVNAAWILRTKPENLLSQKP